jgi:hypothetical protein
MLEVAVVHGWISGIAAMKALIDESLPPRDPVIVWVYISSRGISTIGKKGKVIK